MPAQAQSAVEHAVSQTARNEEQRQAHQKGVEAANAELSNRMAALVSRERAAQIREQVRHLAEHAFQLCIVGLIELSLPAAVLSMEPSCHKCCKLPSVQIQERCRHGT